MEISNTCPDCLCSPANVFCQCDHIGLRKQREMDALRDVMRKIAEELETKWLVSAKVKRVEWFGCEAQRRELLAECRAALGGKETA